MFFVNYHPETGQIDSYTAAPDAAYNDCPAGCETLIFASDIPGFINSNGALTMKVDVTNRLLVLINPQTIPAPIG